MQWAKTSVKQSLLGLLFSVILTLFAFLLVMKQLLAGPALLSALGALACLQAFFQLTLFLNLGREHKPRWNLIVFFCMITVVFIIVFGSIWIMQNLNYNLMQ